MKSIFLAAMAEISPTSFISSMPIQVGDVCKVEAHIVSAINANEGKIAKVKGHVYRGVIEVIL